MIESSGENERSSVPAVYEVRNDAEAQRSVAQHSNVGARSRLLATRLTHIRSARNGFAYITAIAVLLGVRTLDNGLVMDDHGIVAAVRLHLSGSPLGRDVWSMFDWCGRTDPGSVRQAIALGVLPWWSSSRLTISFLRPLAAATHFLDGMLWPDQPWWMHLHNLGWYAALVVFVGCLYRRLLGGMTAGIATVLYAVDDAHYEAVAWIASRNTLMAATFIAATLLAWHRARTLKSPPWLVIASIMLVAAHASSEAGVAVWPYLVGYAAAFESKAVAWRERLLALLPLAAVTCAWQSVVVTLGFVVRDSGVYVDPRTSPTSFATALLQRLPELLRLQLVSPFRLEHAAPAQTMIIGASWVMVALVFLLVLPLAQRQPGMQLCIVGFLGSTVVMCSAPPEPRLWLVSGIGAHAMIAAAIQAGLQAWKQRDPGRYVSLACATVLVVLRGAVPIYMAASRQPQRLEVEANARQVAANLPPGSGPLLILNAPSYLFAWSVALFELGRRPVYICGTSAQPVKLSHPSRNALRLEPAGGYLSDPSSLILRDPQRRFSVGEAILSFGMRVTVEQITADGRPLRVRFEPPDLEDQRATWVTWNPRTNAFERAVFPNIGQSVWLPGVQLDRGPAEAVLTQVFRPRG